MDSYLEQANQVILLMKIQDHKYNEGYEKLLKINETIIQSSDDYYQLVTNVVDKILEKIEVTKQETDVFLLVYRGLQCHRIINIYDHRIKKYNESD